MHTDAILWDYDGTLVNSVPKNIAITKQILSVVAPRLTGESLPKQLQTEHHYRLANHQSKNWQDLYVNYYGLTESEMRKAGDLWTEYQLKNRTPVRFFAEIKECIQQITIPQGICSQNSSNNIKQVLAEHDLSHKFQAIIGYDDIPSEKQKPDAYSGIACLNKMFTSLKRKCIFYIGDHEADVEFAKNLEKGIGNDSKVFAVSVKYSSAKTELWKLKPDFEIASPSELLNIIKKKPLRN